MMIKMIVSELVDFRSLEIEDLLQLRVWRNSDFIRKNCREYLLLNMENQIEWYQSLKKKPPKNIMFGILEKNAQLIGVCGLTQIDWKNRNAEASLYLGINNWHEKAEAYDSLNTLLNYGFLTLNFHLIYVMKYDFDESIELFKKIGFIMDGKIRESCYDNGKYWNTNIYSIVKKEYLR